jgi:hypothetical protein
MQKGSGLALACRPLVFSGVGASRPPGGGSWVALGARVGLPLCPGQAGAGLCFLPQDFLGGPPNPAYHVPCKCKCKSDHLESRMANGIYIYSI